jgi:hypothetical protein
VLRRANTPFADSGTCHPKRLTFSPPHLDNGRMAAAPKKSYRRWLQFRLRTLMIVMTLIIVGLVAWRYYAEPYRRQRDVMQIVPKLRGRFTTAAGTQWQRRLFGPDFCNIVFVNLADCDEPDAYIDRIARLPCLEVLVVGGPTFSDDHLRRLHKLRTLRGLVLDSTSVSNEAVAVLQRALPHVDVRWSQRRSIAALAPAGTVDTGWCSPLPDFHSAVGSDHFYDAVNVLLRGRQISDDHLGHVSRLRTLRSLSLDGAQTSGPALSCLAKLTQLEDLTVRMMTVNDADLQHLCGLDCLFGLNLDYTQVTDVGLRHLRSLRQLRWLGLGSTAVTREGVEDFRRALPSCVVSYWPKPKS